jgi:hypothetical protein
MLMKTEAFRTESHKTHSVSGERDSLIGTSRECPMRVVFLPVLERPSGQLVSACAESTEVTDGDLPCHEGKGRAVDRSLADTDRDVRVESGVARFVAKPAYPNNIAVSRRLVIPKESDSVPRHLVSGQGVHDPLVQALQHRCLVDRNHLRGSPAARTGHTDVDGACRGDDRGDRCGDVVELVPFDEELCQREVRMVGSVESQVRAGCGFETGVYPFGDGSCASR